MADPGNDGEENVVTPPPTEEERETETVDDEVRSDEGSGPGSKDDGPDVSVRLDVIEKELAALKAMMDTLGYGETVVTDADGDGDDDSIEDLFD